MAGMRTEELLPSLVLAEPTGGAVTGLVDVFTAS
jgi:hypothetical protein